MTETATTVPPPTTPPGAPAGAESSSVPAPSQHPAVSPRPSPAARRAALTRNVSTARAVTWTVSVLSGLALFFVVFLLVLSGLQQSRAQDVLYTRFRSELGAATAPFGVAPIRSGDPVALLDIPSVGLSQVVVEGTTGQDLRNGPGHLRATVLPGQLGTSVIFGRSTIYGGPFHDLPVLRPGDRLQVTTGQGRFSYTVEDVRGDGDPQPAALQPDQSRLLLVTTDASGLAATSTVYVDAMLTSQAAVTPPRGPVLTTGSEAELGSDPTALLPLALWLLVLLGAGVFAAWGLTRWGKPQTWLIAIPVILVALWCASDNAAMLLPNLM